MNYNYQNNKKINIINLENNQENEEDSINAYNNQDSNSNQNSAKIRGKKRQRQENSLGELTKNFINFIRDQKNKDIDINEVVKKLKVKKRRIYDITNVLEGILYIYMLSLNK